MSGTAGGTGERTGGGVRVARRFQRSNEKSGSFLCVRYDNSSHSLVDADESYRVDDALEEDMSPVLDLPQTQPTERIAAVVGVLARALARQIVDEIGARGWRQVASADNR